MLKLLPVLLALSLTPHVHAAKPAAKPAAKAADASKKSLYDRLGGEAGVSALAGRFITELRQDTRLDKNARIREIKAAVPEAEAKKRLTTALCHASGGPCKANRAELLKGVPPQTKLGAMEWFYVAQDANRAMDQEKVGLKERQELLELLMRGREKE